MINVKKLIDGSIKILKKLWETFEKNSKKIL